MKICYAVLHYDSAYSEPRGYLARIPIHREIPREMARLGHDVEVVHLFPVDADFQEDGVRYRFVASGHLERSLSRAAGVLLRRDPALYEPAIRAIQTIRASRPDLIHFHSVTLHWNLLLLERLLGDDCPPIVLHFHGGYPARNPLARAVQLAGFQKVSRFLFTTRAHAEPFVKAGLLDRSAVDAHLRSSVDSLSPSPRRRTSFPLPAVSTARATPPQTTPPRASVEELMETSSSFTVRAREEARRETDMVGNPVFLWAGRLHSIKDPLTALHGFELIASAWPGAHLYLHYLTAELLPELRAFVRGCPVLAGRVHFRGRASFEQMEAIYNSADFLLQASLREFSGCAVLEAMACGVIPVVTDIPSFRAMTDDGRHGVLFAAGDSVALAQGVLAVSPNEIPTRSRAVREHFDATLSFPALARRLDDIYRSVLAERTP